jgi:hypothetical protein
MANGMQFPNMPALSVMQRNTPPNLLSNQVSKEARVDEQPGPPSPQPGPPVPEGSEVVNGSTKIPHKGFFDRLTENVEGGFTPGNIGTLGLLGRVTNRDVLPYGLLAQALFKTLKK